MLAVRNYAKFSERQEFRRWAFARIHWLLLDRVRAPRGVSLEDLPNLIFPAKPNQEEKVHAQEILELVGTLPKRQFKVILRTIQGHSVRDIAEEMKISEATVRSLRRFARSGLAMILAKKELIK